MTTKQPATLLIHPERPVPGGFRSLVPGTERASTVLFEPVPAMTGTRLRTASMEISITRSCSWWERVVDSPVVPQGAAPARW